MAKPDQYRLNNRLVTFLPPALLKQFREAAYQHNMCSAELLRAFIRQGLAGGGPASSSGASSAGASAPSSSGGPTPPPALNQRYKA